MASAIDSTLYERGRGLTIIISAAKIGQGWKIPNTIWVFHGLLADIVVVLSYVEYPRCNFLTFISAVNGICTDDDDGCEEWAKLGECLSNPGYMHTFCKKTCNKCAEGKGCY